MPRFITDGPIDVTVVKTMDANDFEQQCSHLSNQGYKLTSTSVEAVYHRRSQGWISYYQAIFVKQK